MIGAAAGIYLNARLVSLRIPESGYEIAVRSLLGTGGFWRFLSRICPCLCGCV